MVRPTKHERLNRRVRFYDRLGRLVIAAGGIGIIAAVLGIFVFIGRETAPLFRPARVQPGAGELAPPGAGVLLAAVDPYREVLLAVDANGLRFADIATSAPLAVETPALGGAAVTAADRSPDGRVALGLSDGRIQAVRVVFEPTYGGGRRIVRPRVHLEEEVRLLAGAPSSVVYRHDGGRRSAMAAVGDSGRLVVRTARWRTTPMGAARARGSTHDLALTEAVTAVALDGSARELAVGTADGRVQVWGLAEAGPPRLEETFEAGAAVTALVYLLGDLSLVVGDAGGGVHTWFRVGAGGDRRFRRIHELARHDAAVVAAAPSQRDKQFLTADGSGAAALHHATTEQTFWRQSLARVPVRQLTFAPKADGFLAVLGDGRILDYDIDNPHPEVTWKSLFGRVWYEGYDAARHVWQSTGGTDEFEPKLSLVPLIFGTAKGTLYAMLFALPLAVLAAIYTAEFATPAVRNTVKPTVEIMASLPSVILGFLAGLWLAPLLEHHVVGTALALLFVPLLVVAGARGWRRLPRRVRAHLPSNAELIALLLLTVAGGALALWLGPALERALFEGGLARWLSAEAGLRYDQRNCLVIGFAMGFAVIPLIFSICEDALASVPASLKAGSLALGATRWQTAARVVLPMALPGVFSAAMIGFGRAVGETMIVLMATGNTPVMEWSIFTGMRTISANIAVELPEAPHQGTLYRVLFLSGLLLFLVTFAVNTAAEEIRLRLREKYRRV